MTIKKGDKVKLYRDGKVSPHTGIFDKYDTKEPSLCFVSFSYGSFPNCCRVSELLKVQSYLTYSVL